MPNIIEVIGLDKVYKLYSKPSDRLIEAVAPFLKKERTREFYALKGMSFSISQGETVGIIGKNGSGKSTLLKILTGVITESHGTVKVGGKVSALLELGAGFNPEYTGIENIYLNGTIMGYTKEQMNDKMDAILSFAEIGDFVYQPVKTYSSGMFVRLAFAVAINVEPEILIVDEALAVGDYRFQAKCYKKFEELKSKGKTILFVTHDVDAVRRFCTRAIWINSGEIIMDGRVNDVTSRYMEFITGDSIEKAPKPKKELDNDHSNLSISSEASTFNPINRFGSNVGSIYYVETFNGDKKTMTFGIGDYVTVRIKMNIPDDADISNVGVAISIKNKNGLDLFVTSSYDKNIRFERTGKNSVQVTFKNYLNNGEYTLITALENRVAVPINYYDYIEGAVYFKVVTDAEYYGLTQFPSEISIEKD